MYGGKEECQSVVCWDIGDPQIACLLETVVFPANLEVPGKGPVFHGPRGTVAHRTRCGGGNSGA